MEHCDSQDQQRKRAQSYPMGRWYLFGRRRGSPAGSLPRDRSQVAEGGQTQWIPARQRDALEGILNRRRYDTASRMASSSKTSQQGGSPMTAPDMNFLLNFSFLLRAV